MRHTSTPRRSRRLNKSLQNTPSLHPSATSPLVLTNSSTLNVLIALTSILPCILLLQSSFSGSSLSPHSNPLRNGDYEAHRRWSSYHVTPSLPLSSYYKHSLDYWGLDYPPFSLYLHSFIGILTKHVLPDYLVPEAHNDLEVKGEEGGIIAMRLINTCIYSLHLAITWTLLKR
ncbi:hypothetical protein TrCOL_g7229 [Triparma columacea]|uniref:Alpha-1,3-glucosyltransferase n=1 Tax=Triparma columacea TaxID=722753 RepID=A0A9W7GK25_9STRA|nr:hypothetical protein TrCOL_g7229 [Triparma columacea]